MSQKINLILLAGALLVVPVAITRAQQNNPAGNMGSNRSATASPGTADSGPASGMTTGDAGSKLKTPNAAAMGSTTPGATGRTVVPGSNSSPARSSAGTAEQKTGTGEGGGK